MRWTPGGRSENLEDRRGASGGGGFRGGGGGGMKLGIGGTMVLLVLSLIFKRDLLTEFSGGVSGDASAPTTHHCRHHRSRHHHCRRRSRRYVEDVLPSGALR